MKKGFQNWCSREHQQLQNGLVHVSKVESYMHFRKMILKLFRNCRWKYQGVERVMLLGFFRTVLHHKGLWRARQPSWDGTVDIKQRR